MKKYISIAANEMDTYSDYAVFSLVAIFILKSTPFEIGLLGACYAIPFYFLSSVYGKYSDKNDVRKLRMLLFSCCAIATPFILIINSMFFLYILLLFKISARVGLATSMPKLNENDNESKRFYELTGYLVNFSRVFVPIVIVFIYSSYGIEYLVLMSFAINMMGFWATFFDKRYSASSLVNIEKNSSVDSSMVGVLKNKKISLLIVSYILSSICLYLSNDMLSYFFRFIGEDEKSIGYIITILGVGGLIGTKIAGISVNKINLTSLYAGSILVNSFSFSLLGFSDYEAINHNYYYLAILITGVSSGMAFVSLKLGIRENVDFRDLASVTGTIQKVAAVVAISLPIFGGGVADLFGIQMPFMITGVFMISLFCYVVFRNYILMKKLIFN